MTISPESTILNVDDYLDGREATSQIMQRAGFNVIEAATGGQALQLAAARRPQLILLDIKLPDLSGYDVCQKLKSDPVTHAIPVLLISGSYTDGEDRVRGLEGGADAYLCKPVEAAELIATIKALLRMRQAEDENARLFAREQAACRRAENANRLKDEFLTTVSHELRAPLNSIQGWIRLLREGRLNPVETARALETIDQGARTQTRIINDLLDVSRIITGRLLLKLSPLTPAHSVETAIDSVRPSAQAKGISLTADLDFAAGPIYADADRLQQIFWNLLSNAVKFTPQGGRVMVSLKRVAENIEIRVSDSGPGIDPEFLPFVFDRFRQQDSSITRLHSGLGLGLAIVRHLVEMHGGAVHVESGVERRGATFIIMFPVMGKLQFPQLSQLSGRTVSEEEKNALDCPPEFQGLRILVVDDHDDARRLIEIILTTCGAKVVVAASAHEALRIMARPPEQRPEILISGIGMPEMDGYQLIHQLRSRPTGQGGAIPAVALTAHTRVEDRLSALAAGFQMHVAKPVNEHELLTVVASLTGRLNRRNGRAGSAELTNYIPSVSALKQYTPKAKDTV